MASISSPGLGSGLDVNSIVTQLMTIEKQPLTQMQQAATKLQTRLSSYGKIQSYVSALQDAANTLSKSSEWGVVSATSSDTDALTTASSGTGVQGTAGSYQVEVQKLASGQTLTTGVMTSATTTGFGTGTLHFGIGGSTYDVAIGSGDDSLAGIRNRINAADIGVSAAVVTDSSGSRLVLRSKTTGEDQAFSISVSDDDGDSGDRYGLSALAYDTTAGITNLQRTQTAADAELTIDGIATTSASNTVTDLIPGVTMKLTKETTSAIDVTVSPDNTSVKTAITNMVNAYNDLAKYLKSETAYDAATKKGSTFQGDSAVNGLRSQLRSIVSQTFGGSGAYTRLAQIGIDPQSDGTLKISSSKLDTALGKMSDVKALFAATSDTVNVDRGFAVQIGNWAKGLLDIEGSITSRTSSLQSQISDNGKKQDAFNLRMEVVEKRMRAQYTALDTQMSKLNSATSYTSALLASATSSSS